MFGSKVKKLFFGIISSIFLLSCFALPKADIWTVESALDFIISECSIKYSGRTKTPNSYMKAYLALSDYLQKGCPESEYDKIKKLFPDTFKALCVAEKMSKNRYDFLINVGNLKTAYLTAFGRYTSKFSQVEIPSSVQPVNQASDPDEICKGYLRKYMDFDYFIRYMGPPQSKEAIQQDFPLIADDVLKAVDECGKNVYAFYARLEEAKESVLEHFCRCTEE